MCYISLIFLIVTLYYHYGRCQLWGNRVKDLGGLYEVLPIAQTS